MSEVYSREPSPFGGVTPLRNNVIIRVDIAATLFVFSQISNSAKSLKIEDNVMKRTYSIAGYADATSKHIILGRKVILRDYKIINDGCRLDNLEENTTSLLKLVNYLKDKPIATLDKAEPNTLYADIWTVNADGKLIVSDYFIVPEFEIQAVIE